MEKAEDKYEPFFGKDVEIKEYDDGAQDVM